MVSLFGIISLNVDVTLSASIFFGNGFHSFEHGLSLFQQSKNSLAHESEHIISILYIILIEFDRVDLITPFMPLYMTDKLCTRSKINLRRFMRYLSNSDPYSASSVASKVRWNL